MATAEPSQRHVVVRADATSEHLLALVETGKSQGPGC